MTTMIEVRIPEHGHSSYGRAWAKVLAAVGEKAKNFYGYEGEFVDPGELVDMAPAGVVVIQYYTRARGGGGEPNAILYRAPSADGGEWIELARASGKEAAIELRDAARAALNVSARAAAAAPVVPAPTPRDLAIEQIRALMTEHAIDMRALHAALGADRFDLIERS